MDEKYMRLAIELAEKGTGYVNPNPLVGCVVVKDDRVVATGWHEHVGGFHAERNALLGCTEDVTGAEMYVTLEPCCHTGRTPPCTDIIIERGIGTVYVGSDDPNPLVCGKGVQVLRDAGVTVRTHVLKTECDRLNEIFFHYITTGRPFVAMKYAMTLDGKITAAGPEPAAITGEQARIHVHGLRKKYASILVGIGTVLSDDPMLNVRLGESDRDCNPTRIVLDDRLRTPLDCAIVRSAREIPTILCCSERITEEEAAPYRQAGLTVLPVAEDPGHAGYADWDDLVRQLGERGIDSILVEGGSAVHGSLLMNPKRIHRVYAYIAPKLFGGETALSPIGGEGLTVTRAPVLSEVETVPLGEDLLITGKP